MGLKKNNPGCGCCGGNVCTHCTTSNSTIDLVVPAFDTNGVYCNLAQCDGHQGGTVTLFYQGVQGAYCEWKGLQAYGASCHPLFFFFGSWEWFLWINAAEVVLFALTSRSSTANKDVIYDFTASQSSINWKPSGTDNSSSSDANWLSNGDCTANLQLTTDNVVYHTVSAISPTDSYCGWTAGTVFEINP